MAARIDLCVCPLGNLLLVGDPSSPISGAGEPLEEERGRRASRAARPVETTGGDIHGNGDTETGFFVA